MGWLIKKYPIELGNYLGIKNITLPDEANILNVCTEDNIPYLYIFADMDKPKKNRRLDIFIDGASPGWATRRYIGQFQLELSVGISKEVKTYQVFEVVNINKKLW